MAAPNPNVSNLLNGEHTRNMSISTGFHLDTLGASYSYVQDLKITLIGISQGREYSNQNSDFLIWPYHAFPLTPDSNGATPI